MQIALSILLIALLVFFVVYLEKMNRQKRAKQIEDFLAYDDLLSWQYSLDLEDEWLVAVNGSVSNKKKTLLQIKEMKENAPTIDIQISHSTFRDDPEAEWSHFYLKRSSIDKAEDKASTALVIAGFFLGLVALIIFPLGFGVASFLCGVFAISKGDAAGGIFIVIFSIACGIAGVFIGLASMVFQ